jgi:hypothetical protein
VYNVTWDAVWNVRTATHLDGWSAEFEIPFNTLRFTHEGEEGFTWGINFRRYISRKHETDEWVMVPRSERLQISQWGHLRGTRTITQRLHLALLPYLSGTSAFRTATLQQGSESEVWMDGGVDVKLGVTRNSTIDATINPDFGQVEVDQSVLNLTVFETLFPEKRPFFLEGSQLFAFGSTVDNTSLPLFFSRRIGRKPVGSATVSAPPGGLVEENPQTTTIFGAAKFTGRSESGLSVGALAAVTAEEDAIIEDSLGRRSEIRTERRAGYSVLRLKREIAGTSWIGGIASLVSRDGLASSGAGGVDWSLRVGNGTHTIDGYLAMSVVPAGDRSSEGYAARVLISRISSEHWLYTTAYEVFTKRFEINDAGFFAQPRDHGGYVQLLYRENFARSPFRRYSIALNPEYRWNLQGLKTHRAVNTEVAFEFVNFWITTLRHTLTLPAYDDDQRGVLLPYLRSASQDIVLTARSDERKPLSGSLTLGAGFDQRSRSSIYSVLDLKIRPVPWCEVSPYLLWQRVRGEETGVFSGGSIVTSEGRNVFADRALDQLDLALRGLVTFSTTMSLQFFTQALIARADYEAYRLHTGERGFIDPTVAVANHDFNFVTLNANVLLRWEFLPGSAAYLVWTQERSGVTDVYRTAFGRRIGDAFKLPHEDAIVLKVSYWIPL